MSFSTVGELIDVLQKFDRATPLLKMCGTKYYYTVDFITTLTYRVKESSRPGRFVDCNDEKDAAGFDAIVL